MHRKNVVLYIYVIKLASLFSEMYLVQGHILLFYFASPLCLFVIIERIFTLFIYFTAARIVFIHLPQLWEVDSNIVCLDFATDVR